MTTPVDAKQLALATNALLAFIHGENQANNNLLEDDGFISLVVTLARTPEKGRTKPFYAPLTHSLYKDRPVCLITCDGLYKTVKEHLKTHPVEGVEKVLSITKLRKEFGRYEAKRKLSDSYDLFLADARLLHLLPQLIGAKFFDKKKHPSIIDLSKADVTSSLIKGRDATYFHLRAGPTLMVKIARTSFSDKQIIENFNAAIGAIVEQIPKKWKGVQALYLRTATSIALPFYNSLPFSLKIQDSDTPQLALPSKGKRKADSDEKETSTKKRAITSLPSSAPFSTLTITGIKPEAEETLEEEDDDSDSPSSPQAKRKAVATPRAPPAAPAAATPKPVSTKKKQKVGVTPKAAPATPVAQPVAVSTPAKPGTQKKKKAGTPAQSAVPSTPVVSATPKTSLKKKKTAPTPAVQPAAPATPQAPVVSATPKPSLKKAKVGATPKVAQAAPATPQATVAATPKPSLKKAKVGATPKVAQAVPATPAAAVIPAQSTKKPKVAATPKVVAATPTVKASTIKKKKAPAS